MHFETFAILADPTRLKLVEALRAGGQQVNDLVARVDIHQLGVSRHLKILSEAGFVRVRPMGSKRLYSLQPQPFQELESWLEKFRSTWEARMDRFGAELERRKRTREEGAK